MPGASAECPPLRLPEITYPIPAKSSGKRAQKIGVLFRAVFSHDGFVQSSWQGEIPTRRGAKPHPGIRTQGRFWKKRAKRSAHSLFVCSQSAIAWLCLVTPNVFFIPLASLPRGTIHVWKANPGHNVPRQGLGHGPSAQRFQGFF